MAFNFGGQAGNQPTPAFGFSTPQTQSGFQFGTTNPTFGIGTGTQQPTTTTSAFNFGSGGNVSFGAPVFGTPAATSTTGSTFGGFGAPAGGTASGFTFGQAAPAPAPAFGAVPTGGSTFGAVPATAAVTTASSFFSGGNTFTFGNTGAAAPAPAPQFGAPTAAPTATVGQPFSFSAPTTTTPNIFGGTGFTLGGAPAAPIASTAPSLLSGGTTTFNFGGFGAPATSTASTFQPAAIPSMPLLTTTTSAPTPFGTTPSTVDVSQVAPVPGFGVTPTSLPSIFSGGLGVPGTTVPASIAPTFKPPTTTITSSTTTASSGFGMFPSLNVPASGPATPSNLTFGPPATTKISLTGLTPTVTTTTTTNSGLTFGNLPTSTASVAPLSSVTVVPSSTAAPTFSLGTSLFTAPKAPTTSTTTTTIVPVTTTTSSTTVTTSAVTTSSGTIPAFSIGLPTILTSTGTSPTATVTDTTSAVAPGTQMTFRQLEEAINKWNLELGDQERIFLNQATQVNAWDRLLISNGLKIKDLHESVERVKLEQERLDHELDFIVSQQRELEDLLAPLEKALDDTPALSIQQHADLQREHTYHMAEKVDCQLKRMAEDIKQIIEHLNTSQNQDDTDPMLQVSKILNAHMDALQWVDQNTELLQKKLEEISKVMESTKKDQEASWRITYN